MKRALIWMLSAFAVPILLTLVWKLIASLIGPVVPLYSEVAACALAAVWGQQVGRRAGRLIGAATGITVLILAFLLIINYFMWLTALAGEMDYQML
jgi:fucose 4-O-acetylase-like acetyltransferase